MDFPPTITVDESLPMPADSVLTIDPEIVRIPFDGRGVEVWNGKKYIRRRSRVVYKRDNIFLLEVIPPTNVLSLLKLAVGKLVGLLRPNEGCFK